MPVGQYLLGAVFFVLTVGAVGAAAGLIVLRRLSGLPRLARGLAFGLLWLAALGVSVLIPAAATVLSRGTALLTAALVLAAATFVRPASCVQEAPVVARLRESRLSCVLAVLGVGVVALVALGYTADTARTAVEGNDFLTFAMPNVGRWVESGSIWMSNQFTPLIQTSTYPNNGDLIQLSVLLPWHDDAFVRLVNLPLYAMIGLSVYATARELGAARTASALMAALVLSIQDVSQPALELGKPDTFMLATLGIGLFFLLRHHRTQARADLLLAGLGLGLAFGAAWFGISTVVVVVTVWAGGGLLARRPPPALARDGGVLVGMILFAGGFWLVRNWVVTGNPLYPVHVAALGWGAPHDPFIVAYNFTVAHYLLRPTAFVHDLAPLYRYGIGIAGGIVLLGSLLAIVVGVASRRHGQPRETRATAAVVLALMVCALTIVAAYVITPASAQGPPGDPVLAPSNARWVLGAFLLAGVAAAWAAGRVGRAGLVVEAAALAGVGIGLHQQFATLPAGWVAAAAVALALLAAIAWLALAALRRVPAPARRLAQGGAAAVFAVGAVAAGGLIQRRVDDTRYANLDPVLRWFVTSAPSGHRVGITGVWSGIPVNWAAFGPHLGNEVGYVGYTVDHMLVQYAGRQPFVRALRRGRYDLVVLGRGWNPENLFQRSSPFSPTSVAEQASWIESAGFRLTEADGQYLVYRKLGTDSG